MSPRFRFVIRWLRLNLHSPPKLTCSSVWSRTALTRQADSAPTRIVVESRRINDTSFPFSATVPTLRRSSQFPPRRASTSCGSCHQSSARCRKTRPRSTRFSTGSRPSRHSRTPPCRSSINSCVPAAPSASASAIPVTCAPRDALSFDIESEEHLQ